MDIDRLERDMADRFKMCDGNMQALKNQIDRLQELVVTMVAKNYIAAEDFSREIQKPVPRGKPPLAVSYPRNEFVKEPEPLGDLDFAKQRIEALEKSEMDQAETIAELRDEKKGLIEELKRRPMRTGN